MNIKVKFKLFLLSLAALALPIGASASLWSYWQDQGLEFIPCNQERAELAAEYAVFDYDCSQEKNDLLESRLRDAQARAEENIGAAVATGYKTTLQSSMTSSQLTVPVSSLALRDGTTLTMAALDNVVFLVAEPGSTREEIIKCTIISSAQFATCTRGLAFSGSTETSVAANRSAHRAGSVVIMSNVHYVYEQLVDKDTDQTVTGILDFDIYPTVTSTIGNATTSQQLITLNQANNIGNQGAATSTQSASGISEQATRIETASSTSFDADNPHYISSEFATSTCQVAQLNVIISENDGNINPDCIEQGGTYAWTGPNSHGGNEIFNGTGTFNGNATFNGTGAFNDVVTFSDITTFNATSTMVTSTMDALEVTSSTIDRLDVDGVNINDTLLGGSTTDAAAYHTHKNIAPFGTSVDNDFYNYYLSTVSPDGWATTDSTVIPNASYIDIQSGAATWEASSLIAGVGSDNNLQGDDNKTIIAEFRARATNGTSGDRTVGFSTDGSLSEAFNGSSNEKVAFSTDGTTLFSYTSNQSNSTNNVIGGITVTNWNLYKIEWNQSTDTAIFSVNGTVGATHSTTTPTSANPLIFGAGGQTNTEDWLLSSVAIQQEL